jgi:SAM-dependent methyltransferase
MERELFDAYARSEECHWWFVARRAILQHLLEHLCRGGRPRRILEIGCGTGGNLPLLARYGTLQAVEQDDQARALANRRRICPVQAGSLPHALPVAGRFDLICLLDVLEHVEDDGAALREVAGRLTDGGWLLISVPAYRFLWSAHDVANQHRRRYHRRQLVQLVREAGLHVAYATYCNTLLFPAIAASRLIGRCLGGQAGSDLHMPPRALNDLLMRLFALERRVMPRLRLPFGVSLLVVARSR